LSSISKTWEGYALNVLLGEHVFGLLPKGTHEYDLLITPETVENILKGGNPEEGVVPFEVITKTGVGVAGVSPMSFKNGFEMTEYPQFTRANYMLMARARTDL
jgi:2-polyprenyl-3-methyl-5-hydroxy-6-metoxy-1,4-benzoquinol methylase